MAGALEGVHVVKFKDAEHLVRLAVAFAVVLLVFLLLREHFIPKSFGEYGHYRGDALAELSPNRFTMPVTRRAKTVTAMSLP